jgi:hypothetical protein
VIKQVRSLFRTATHHAGQEIMRAAPTLNHPGARSPAARRARRSAVQTRQVGPPSRRACGPADARSPAL